LSEVNHINGIAICLVDDDPSVLRATGRLLSSAGRQVRSFTDPSAFLNYAKAEQPRLAILDMLMPQMHGLEVQRRLRDVSPATRVIILTSKDDPFVRSRAMDAGAAGFFLKPVNGDEFLSGVDAVLGHN
jgi:FixJ family two-component response regulator